MAHDSERPSGGVSRRKFVVASGTAGIATLAGCSSQSDNGNGGNNGSNGGSGPQTTSGNGAGSGPTALNADGSSTVFPIANQAAVLWNGNPPADDTEYWGPSQYGVDTDQNLADYFAGLYGFEATGQRSTAPFSVQIALSHSGTGVEAVLNERVDIGNASSTAESILGSDADELDNIVDHVVGVDGQPVVVSREIKDAGVDQITGDELRAIYKQEITNWSEVGGPDKDIYAVGRAEDSGTDTAFRANLYGDPEEPISPDARRGQNQQVQTLVSQNDNAIAYIALAFVEPDGGTPPIGLELDGTLYEFGNNLGAEEYPLSRDLHCYTWEDTDERESAFINMILSEFGQQNCVAPNNYFMLPESRREEERQKLADQA